MLPQMRRHVLANYPPLNLHRRLRGSRLINGPFKRFPAGNAGRRPAACKNARGFIWRISVFVER